MIHPAITKTPYANAMLFASRHFADVIGTNRGATFEAQDLGRVVCGNIVGNVVFFLGHIEGIFLGDKLACSLV